MKNAAIGSVTAIAWLALLYAIGCTSEPVCAEGTLLKDGNCVLAAQITCGAGTVKAGDGCVLSQPDGGGGDGDAACVPSCGGISGQTCGDDGCGGSCGTCADGKVCIAGSCSEPIGCVPICVDKVCGDNGCGGSCGTCPGGETCEKGQCLPICVPNCLGKACGSDSCTGTCGTCASPLVCGSDSLCVPSSWTCKGFRYGNDGLCDCGCGAEDPDCTKPSAPLIGCDQMEKCVAGMCLPVVPAAWTCAKITFGDGATCHCGCGAPDPDCLLKGANQTGCNPGKSCSAQGTCEICNPKCSGVDCGSDGCGGSCGNCPMDPGFANGSVALACVSGSCVSGCFPSPSACKFNECGDDGCGGSCGSCGPGAYCAAGKCIPEPGKSCQGLCKANAPGGCSCSFGCDAKGSCCPDYEEVCVCKPNCGGKACGPDGCGGICGKCPGKNPYCDAAGKCQAACSPVCNGKSCGPDGCGGSCGTCPGGGSCNNKGICVPPTWSCMDDFFGDGSTCDCSCGDKDPDCKTIGLTVGCPLAAACDALSGTCKLPFCTNHAECKAPAWCVGHHAVGGGMAKGVCSLPNPMALATGAICTTDAGCASALCIAGTCRDPCAQDSHCPSGVPCLAVAPPQGLAGKPKAAIGVCLPSGSIGKGCAAQSDCKPGSAVCLALLEPATLKATLRCGTLPSPLAEGQDCDETPQCAIGLLCAAGQCSRACPGGAKDCSAGKACKPAILFAGASTSSTDDVIVNACTAGK